MKYGTYFAYWEKEWEADYIYYCQKVADIGFDVLEVSGAGLIEMDDLQLNELREKAKECGITLTGCIGFPKEYDTSSIDEETGKKGIEFAKKIIDSAAKAGIDRIGGIMYSYWPVDFSINIDKELSRKNSIKNVRIIADYAAQYGITILLETVNRYEQYLFNRASEAVEFVKEVGRSNVKVMLDVFHMNIEEDYIGEAIRQTGDYLGHLHIGECNRKVPGKGHMPWDEIAQALHDINYDQCVVMEPFVMSGGRIGYEIKVWHDLIDDTSQANLDKEIKEALEFIHEKFD